MNETNDEAGMPIRLTLDPGIYYRCTCGKSENLPFCDGAHPPGKQVPIRFEIKERQQVYLCSCGRTGKAPFCDGTCGVKI